MKKVSTLILALGTVAMLSSAVAFANEDPSGKALFDKNCAMCHKDGGNVMKPDKTLHEKDLKANGLNTADGIVKFMRNPGDAMPKFSKAKVSDTDAKKIADYILKEFKK